MDESAKPRLVRCPKCQNVLHEQASYSVYQCGGCGTVLRGTLFLFIILFYLYENLDKDVVFDFIIYLSEMFVCIYCIVCFFLKKQDSGSRISFSVFLLLFAFDVNPRVPEGIESDK
jgi:hypothetical protein